MEPKYIVAITALSLFCVLFFIFFILLAHRRKAEAKLQAWLHEVYSDRNFIKSDYDAVPVDDEALKLIENGMRKAETQNGEKQEAEEVQLKIDDAFNKIEIEGIEEITGNYNPE